VSCHPANRPHIVTQSDSLGMDAHSINIPLPDEDPTVVFRVDVPMRSFLGGYYPHLIKLYKHVGVEFRRADYSYSLSKFSFARGKGKLNTSVLYNGNSGLAGISMPSDMYDTNDNTSSFNVSYCIMRMSFLASSLVLLLNYMRVVVLACPLFQSPDTTFGAWIEENCPQNLVARSLGFDESWKHLCYDILLPLFSGICTASREEMLSHPVLDFLDCIWAGLFGHHYVAANNVHDVVGRLSRPIRYTHTNCAITHMSPDSKQSGKIALIADHGGQTFSGFAHVIFACPASAVPSILSTYLDKLPSSSAQKLHVEDVIECTKIFNYRTTVTINHTDESLLPSNIRDRRHLNLVDSIPDAAWPLDRTALCRDHTCTMATQVIPCPTPTPDAQLTTTIYQTTNPMFAPRPDSILSVSCLERAVLTVESKKALRGLSTEERKWWQSYSKRKTHLGQLQGCGRLQDKSIPGIWLCGSYASAGIPLLEGCVVSAKDVVDQGILASEGIRHADFEW